MKVDKGNTLLNVVFGLFMIASIIRVSMDVHERYKKKKDGHKKQ